MGGWNSGTTGIGPGVGVAGGWEFGLVMGPGAVSLGGECQRTNKSIQDTPF